MCKGIFEVTRLLYLSTINHELDFQMYCIFLHEHVDFWFNMTFQNELQLYILSALSFEWWPLVF